MLNPIPFLFLFIYLLIRPFSPYTFQFHTYTLRVYYTCLHIDDMLALLFMVNWYTVTSMGMVMWSDGECFAFNVSKRSRMEWTERKNQANEGEQWDGNCENWRNWKDNRKISDTNGAVNEIIDYVLSIVYLPRLAQTQCSIKHKIYVIFFPHFCLLFRFSCLVTCVVCLFSSLFKIIAIIFLYSIYDFILLCFSLSFIFLCFFFEVLLLLFTNLRSYFYFAFAFSTFCFTVSVRLNWLSLVSFWSILLYFILPWKIFILQ